MSALALSPCDPAGGPSSQTMASAMFDSGGNAQGALELAALVLMWSMADGVIAYVVLCHHRQAVRAHSPTA